MKCHLVDYSMLHACFRRANEEVQPGFSSDDEMEECSPEWPPENTSSLAVSEPRRGTSA